MKAIIIDDENKGREILSRMIGTYCPDVTIIGIATNAEEGYSLIKKTEPDLVFLDIEMPNGNGFSLLQRFDEIPFQLIFTTAYENYAIKAIRHHALDYLLKPIDIDELRTSVKNAAIALKNKPAVNRYAGFIAERKAEVAGKIGLPIKDGIVYLNITDIIRVESDGSYSTFFSTDGKKYMVSKNLKEFEDQLPAKEFFRSHKSHLINIRKVKKYLRTDGYFAEMEDGSMIEIARRKKDEFLQLMNSML